MLDGLADAPADTSTPHGKLILTVLGGLAEFERSLILARTRKTLGPRLAASVMNDHPS
jgi:DNA invertase Pin-like site-specific DNA recombinase